MLITFEGIDGSGKTTQIELLKNYLIQKKYDVVTYREPGGTTLAENIRSLLLDKQNEINSVSEMLLFEAARADLTEKAILPALKKNKIVILDRYYDSTTSYQGYGRGLDLSFIYLLNKFATYNTTPDLTFYLRIPYELSLERRKENSDRMELSDEDFFQRLIRGFDKIAEENSERVKVIDATQSIENIHKSIVEIVNLKLLNK